MGTAEPKKYVLDTSALLAYYQDEEGADQVAQVLAEAARGAAIVYLSFMTIFEVAYLATEPMVLTRHSSSSCRSGNWA